jgi:hypothetical protein
MNKNMDDKNVLVFDLGGGTFGEYCWKEMSASCLST